MLFKIISTYIVPRSTKSDQPDDLVLYVIIISWTDKELTTCHLYAVLYVTFSYYVKSQSLMYQFCYYSFFCSRYNILRKEEKNYYYFLLVRKLLNVIALAWPKLLNVFISRGTYLRVEAEHELYVNASKNAFASKPLDQNKWMDGLSVIVKLCKNMSKLSANYYLW